MSRVLVKLYVPIIEEKYDIWLPTNKKIYNIIEKLEFSYPYKKGDNHIE